MDMINKTIQSGIKNMNNYYNYTNESLIKNYCERDTFNISNKFISQQEWPIIYNLLINSNNFNTISLSGVNLDSFGLKKLSEILLLNKSIKTIKLDWNYLNELSEEFDIFCENISKNNSIQYLHLNNNKISSIHSTSISKILRFNNNILQLDLRWNEIGNDGARNILEGLNYNNIIQELNLTGNQITQELIFEINEKLNFNKNLFYNVNFNRENKKISNINEILKNSNSPKNNLNQSTYLKFFRENNYNNVDNELINEYKARYDSQLLNNSNLEKKNKELEILLNNEKVTHDDFKLQIMNQLQLEKDKMLQYEDQLLKSKEEYMKKEFDWKKLLGESEKEISILYLEKNDLSVENKLFINEVEKLKQSYENKLKNFEFQYNKTKEFLENENSDFKKENEFNRKEFNESLIHVNTEWEKRYKNVEDQLRLTKSTKDEIEKENFVLRRELNEFKMNRDLEIRERESRIIEEENRKHDNLIKQFEIKFKTFEITKYEINQKNSKLLLEIENLRKTLTEENSKYEINLERMTQEKNNLNKNVNSLSNIVNKLNADISIKEGNINKLKNDMNSINISIQNNFNENSNKIQEMISEFTKEKHDWEKQTQDLKIQIENLQNSIEEYKTKLIKKDKEKFIYIDNLKKEVAKHIEEKFKEKRNY